MILILSAWEPEIAPLRALLARPTARALARSVRCRAVGVGAIDAGIGAAHAIAEVQPARVIFIGTAGSYAKTGGALPIGAVVLPEELVLCSTATLRGDGYLPAPMVQRVPVTAELHADLRRSAPDAAARGAAATPLAITRTLALARRIARVTGAIAENLESFAVARAAARAERAGRRSAGHRQPCRPARAHRVATPPRSSVEGGVRSGLGLAAGYVSGGPAERRASRFRSGVGVNAGGSRWSAPGRSGRTPWPRPPT